MVEGMANTSQEAGAIREWPLGELDVPGMLRRRQPAAPERETIACLPPSLPPSLPGPQRQVISRFNLGPS